MVRWGATDDDLRRTWPGDELSPKSPVVATRAVTIQAPTARVWPWIVQIGQDRAGYYSYTWLENLLLADMRNTYRIVPEWQTRYVGGNFWMAPPHRYGGQARMVVARLEPGRALVLVHPQDVVSALQKGYAPNGSWNFLLDAVDENTTRLVMRSIAPEKPSLWSQFAYTTFWEPAHFIMERKMMLTIKALAERAEQEAT
jgi:hypothetical protein